MKNCKQCKIEFEPSKLKQVFCSTACRTKYHRAIKKAKTSTEPYVILDSGEIIVKDEELKKRVVGGVFIPQPPQSIEKTEYTQKVMPLIIQIDRTLESQIPRNILIEISRECPFKHGVKRAEWVQNKRVEWLSKNKLKNNQ